MNALRANPTTGEVFLLLLAPHENIIITPPRESDAADLVLILNDPRVYKFLVGPPIPYHLHQAEEWLEMAKKDSDEALEDLRKGKMVVGGCPVQRTREARSDGTEFLPSSFFLSGLRR